MHFSASTGRLELKFIFTLKLPKQLKKFLLPNYLLPSVSWRLVVPLPKNKYTEKTKSATGDLLNPPQWRAISDRGSSCTLLCPKCRDGHHQLVDKKVEAVLFSTAPDRSEKDIGSLILYLDSGYCKLPALYVNLTKNKRNSTCLKKASAKLLFSSIFRS